MPWFNKHREEYEKYLMNPARAFVISIGPFIKFINPVFDTEPKFNELLSDSISDMRFAKKPYKDFFLIRFGKSKWDSEIFLYLDRNGIELGAFVNNEKTDGHRRFEENISAQVANICRGMQAFSKSGVSFLLTSLRNGTEPIADHFNPKT